jgi:hypothetical protein
LREDRLEVSEEIFFGARLIKTMAVEPDWTRPDEKHAILTLALDWFDKNIGRLPCRFEIEKNRAWFFAAENALGEKLPPFELAWRDYLYRQLRRSLKIEDLLFFFQFHPALQRIDLHHLLPHRWLKKLNELPWPERLQIKEMELPLEYIHGKPFLVLDHGQFHRLEAADIRLPSGEAPGFLLQGESFPDWAAAATHYNARLKEEIFERKWRHEKKSVQVKDIQDIPFPLAFQGGNGKDNSRFEFYSAPAFEDGEVFLVHFPDLEAARAYYRSIEKQWGECRTRFRKTAMENIFRDKGWKIKP